MATPWINFREMKKISSKQNKYTEWRYQTKIDDESPFEQTFNGNNNLLDEIEDKPITEESTLTDHIISNEELPEPMEPIIEEENEHHPNFENFREDASLAELLASNEDLPISKETNVEQENEHPLDIDESHTKVTLIEQLASIPIPIEANVKENEENFRHMDENHVEELTLDQIACNQIVPSPTKVEIDHLLDSDENSLEEQNSTAQSDNNPKSFNRALSEAENNMHLDDIAEKEKNNPPNRNKEIAKTLQGEVCTIIQKSPFSTYVEISDFLHAPIYGENVQNTIFDFLDLNDNLSPQLQTKLLQTISIYPEQPDCRLVSSNINQMISLMRTDTNKKNGSEQHPFKSVVVPLHNSQAIKKGEINSSEPFIHIRVPVVLGEYKIEICMEEKIAFDKGIEEVKEITNEVVLSDCRFVPIRRSQSLGNGTRTVLKGNLFIEGYIQHNIEYRVSNTQNKSAIHPNRLCQNIVLELIIQMLQVQKIKVLFDWQGNGGL
ncbi:BC_2427 family protein [Lysinibacillus sp. FSL K6-4013]|uniref:BC_2427 family protein n=1 Tax=Lysinibacillus sp. FSL K6-4013 TaxID=2921504 RepID=UPI00315AC9A1